MICELCRDPLFLGRKAVPAELTDLETAKDLRDTLIAHQDGCVGMAANMIGKNKAIICFFDGRLPVIMLNPEIISREFPFSAEEGCLSLNGTRETERFRKIRVRYQDMNMKRHEKTYQGWTAQIIQHECDHLNGILI